MTRWIKCKYSDFARLLPTWRLAAILENCSVLSIRKAISTNRFLISGLSIGTLVGCAGYVPGRQSYWDAQVMEMCAQDGGTKVFEVVELSEEQYARGLNKLGHFDIPVDSSASGNALYVHSVKRTTIREGNPVVWRYETTVLRKSDKKVLGTQVTYSRVGGDFPSPAHDSSFSCPTPRVDLFSAVIKQVGVR